VTDLPTADTQNQTNMALLRIQSHPNLKKSTVDSDLKDNVDMPGI